MKKVLVLLFVLKISFAFAQSKVEGIVLDKETKLPLIGASILVPNTSTGALTDYDGKFEIILPQGTDRIEVSYIGYMTKVINDFSVKSGLEILLESSNVIDEVVVVGYTTQLKKDLTGSVSVVNINEVGKVPYANALQALQGRVSGVNFTQDGQPGSGRTQVRVRGFTSFNNSDPLLVVDGIPTQEPLDNINPNDIESIQILKDASASIYGSRSAAGVIIVTTKKGKKGKLSIDAGTSIGYNTIANKIDLLNAQQWGDVYWKASKNSDPNKKPQFTSYFDLNGKPQVVIDPQYYDLSVKDQVYTYTPEGTDWYKEVYNNATTQDYHINISNANDKGSVMFGASYLNQPGIIKTSFYNRYTARLNSNYNISKLFNVYENLSVSKSTRLGVSSQTDQGGIPFDVIRQHPAHPVRDTSGNFAGRVGNFPDVRNTVSRLEKGKNNTTDSWRIFGNVGITADIFKGLKLLDDRHSLKFTVNYGIDFSNYFVNNFSPAILEGVYQITQNSYYNSYGEGTTNTLNNLLEYSFVSDDHKIEVNGGVESVSYKFRDLSGGRTDYVVEVPSYVTISSGGALAGVNGTRNNWGLFSEFGRLDYGYKDRYLLTGIVRHDRTSRFKNGGTFPTVMAAWRISQESFFKSMLNGSQTVNDLKLRASWGKLGNQNTTDNPYAAYSTYGPQDLNSNYDIYSTNTTVDQGFSVINRGNPFLKWETTTQMNLGFDATLFSDKLTLSLDVYNKDTKDLLDNPPGILAIGEGTAPYVNLAKVNNKGLDVSLTYAIGNTDSDFSVSNSFNFSIYKNKIVELKDIYPLGNDGERYTNKEVRIAEGRQLGEFYGWINDGIFQNQAEVDAHATQIGKGIGRLRYRDVNGDGVINEGDRTYIGSPHPDFTLGLNNSFRYKKLYLDLFWYASIGNKIFNTTKWVTDFAQNGTYNRRTEILNAWSEENTSATIPKLTLDDGGNDEGRSSSYYVEDGSFLKLRTFRLGYEFAASWLGGNTLSMYGEVQNAFRITKYSGVDPELPQTFRNAIGIDAAAYPLPRIFIFGVNIKI